MRYRINCNSCSYSHDSLALAGLHASQLADDTGKSAVVYGLENSRWVCLGTIYPPACERDADNDTVRQLTTWVRGRGFVVTDTMSNTTDPAEAVELCDSLRGTRHAGFCPADL